MLRRKPTKIEVTIDDKDELEEARPPSSAAASTYLKIPTCVVSLKAEAVLVDGVSRVEEDEEEIDAGLGRACADESWQP
ncbi:hypothetical protein LINPERHAP1_LOCUS8623, partial [Linum perenne]